MREMINLGKGKYALIPLASLWLLLLGMQAAVSTALDGRGQYQDMVWICGIAALILLVLAWLPGRWALAGTGVLFAGMGIYLWRSWERIVIDLQILAYHVNQRNMDYVNRLLLPQSWCKGGTLDHNTVVLLACIVFGWYVALVGFRFYSKFYGFIPVVLLYCGGLLLGKAPGQMATLLLVIGIGLGMMWISDQQRGKYVLWGQHRRRRGKRDSGMRYLITLCILALGVSGAWQITAQISGRAFRNVDQIQKRQHEIETVLQRKVEETGQYIRSMLGMDGGGRLSNTSPRYQDKKVMEVTLDHKPEETVYLRGFVADIYHRGKWSASDEITQDNNMKKKRGQSLWEGKYNDSYYTSLMGDIQDISIRYTKFGRRSKYLYLPYSEVSAVDSSSAEEKDRCLGYEDDYLELYARLVEEWNSDPYFQMDDYTVTMLQDILWNNAEYSTDLDMVPYNQDYAEYFLFESQKGYCEHFATAGTLLLRYLGLCARYATGYRIDTDQFEQNKDGTYTAEVLDSDAHAWTEVLTEDNYWLPQEMTPGRDGGTSDIGEASEREQEQPYSSEQEETGIPEHPDAPVTEAPQESLSDISKDTETEAPADLQTAQEDRQNLSGDGESQGQEPEPADVAEQQRSGGLLKLSPGLRIGIGVLCLLVVCICVIVFVRFHQKRKRKRRMKQMRISHPKYYIGMRLGLMLERLHGAGVAVHGRMPEQQWMPVLTNVLGDQIDPKDMEKLLDLARRAAYSREKISAEEVQWMDRYCERIEVSVKK